MIRNETALLRKVRTANVVQNKAGKVTAFEIDRRKWGRGITGGNLLAFDIENEDGNSTQEVCMCCLGVYLKACGVKAKDLVDIGMPMSLGNVLSSVWTSNDEDEERALKILPKEASWLVVERTKENSGAAKKLARINDVGKTSDAKKEAAVIKEFAKQGIKVTFTH